MESVTAGWIGIDSDMFLRRAMAGLAGNAEFSRSCLDDLGLRILSGLAGSRMTADTAGVPDLVCVVRLGIEKEYIVARHPPLILEQIGERKTKLHVPKLSGDPVGLHVV